MRKQRKMSQIKKQVKTSETELNNMEASNLPETEFKTLVIKILKKLSENFNRERVSIKKAIETRKMKLSEIKNTITELKTIPKINKRLDEAED